MTNEIFQNKEDLHNCKVELDGQSRLGEKMAHSVGGGGGGSSNRGDGGEAH